METRRSFLRRLGLLGVGLALPAQRSAAALGWRATDPSAEAVIAINQVGFLPGEPKRAIVLSPRPLTGDRFHIVDAVAPYRVRYTGALCACETGRGENPNASYAVFDALDRRGHYRLQLPVERLSDPFSIDRDLYAPLIPLILRFFAMQTCGANCAPLHGLCHPDDGVVLGGPRDGQPIDASGGWHDAGDYLKFVETTSYVTGLMLFACDLFPHLAVPKAGRLSPLMAEARVGLEWLLKMHPAPNEFYYQVGSVADHDRWRLPEQDRPDLFPEWKPRPVYSGVGANLAGRTAAALALGSRLYARHDRPFAARCLAAAQSAFALGLQHPEVLTTTPTDFYPESSWEDDMAWGGAELFRATHRPGYLQQALEFAHRAGAAGDQTSVYNTHALAHFTLHALAPDEDRDRLRRYLRADADLARERAGNLYGLATPYLWGTSEAATGAALNCLLYAHLHEGDSADYLEVARHNRDFVLGCNPFGVSNLIGAGTRYPQHPHHQVANLRQIELTGALVGGPTSAPVFGSQKIVLTQAEMGMIPGPIPPPDLPDQAAVYHDAVQDYVTNEAAIDYTAKFLLLTAFYQRHS